MASGLFALLDDIAVLMDDVSVMGKVALKETAGILGDDLAVNAEKASGFVSSRELPVLWAITKGSFLNKLIILPVAFILSAYVPVVITVLLVLGGLYLAFEGAEKIYHFIVPHKESHHEQKLEVLTKEQVLEKEKSKIRSAIFTDFILSVEIVIIALGTVVNENLTNQIIIVTGIAILATIGVYGIVAIIVRFDDFGRSLINLNEEKDTVSDKIGWVLVKSLPWIIKGLSVVGTLALLLVSGGIFAHNIHLIHNVIHGIPEILGQFLVGLVVGFIALLMVKTFVKVQRAFG
ncbi:MAG: DUF808 domain-containing protein [Flavobacteriales bacterium]|nr:DUF808 domain-containing protein [Flavobacteriales bacterium]